jgi:hypothetical protein
MNLEDMYGAIYVWRVSGEKNYANAMEALMEKFNDLESEYDDIEELRQKCIEEQDKFNSRWNMFPKLNVF